MPPALLLGGGDRLDPPRAAPGKIARSAGDRHLAQSAGLCRRPKRQASSIRITPSVELIPAVNRGTACHLHRYRTDMSWVRVPPRRDPLARAARRPDLKEGRPGFAPWLYGYAPPDSAPAAPAPSRRLCESCPCQAKRDHGVAWLTLRRMALSLRAWAAPRHRFATQTVGLPRKAGPQGAARGPRMLDRGTLQACHDPRAGGAQQKRRTGLG